MNETVVEAMPTVGIAYSLFSKVARKRVIKSRWNHLIS